MDTLSRELVEQTRRRGRTLAGTLGRHLEELSNPSRLTAETVAEGRRQIVALHQTIAVLVRQLDSDRLTEPSNPHPS